MRLGLRAPGMVLLVAASLTVACSKERGGDAAKGASPATTPGTALRFENVDSLTGIRFLHAPHRTESRHMPEIMGSGVVLADFNRDGAPDLVLVNSGDMTAAERPADARNRLYLNDGRGRFQDATDAWRLPSPGYGMGGAPGDFDGDGWTDLYLTTWGGGDRLLRNTGHRFEDVTARSGLRPDDRWSTGAGFFDMDADGDLDLIVIRYVDFTIQNAVPCYIDQLQVYCTPDLYRGVGNRLYRNNGDGTFADVSEKAGLRAFIGKGLALAIGDIDKDGDQDIYIANDNTRNQLLLNDGHGRFEDTGILSGTAYSEEGKEQAGMGADFSDTDGDGRSDIVCTNFQDEANCIYRQVRNGFFRESSDAAGVGASSRAVLSFGCDFFDADNDGDEDLMIANGHIDDLVSRHKPSVSFAQENSLYEAEPAGMFREVHALAGPALRDKQVSRGLATGDLDGDGDLDFIVNNNGGSAQVGLNAGKPAGHFIGLLLEGRRANRSAIGARVTVRAGGRSYDREIAGAMSYLSVSDFRVHLGLGEATRADEVVIHWPGSGTQTISGGLGGDRYYRVVEGEAPVAFTPGEGAFAP